MPELPIELKKLEPVPGALAVIRYLDQLPDGAADSDEIMDGVGISERIWGKVTRRLVTTGYIQMRSDYVYELTQKGNDAAETLREFDAAGGAGDVDDGSIQRQVVMVVPRNLVAGQSVPLKIGFAPNSEFSAETNIVLRLDATHAQLGDFDEALQLNADAKVVETTLSAEQYDQARLKLQVYQLSQGGDDLSDCGGMYVDITIMPEGDTGSLYAYSADLSFKP